MMAPLPTPSPPGDRPDLPRARLSVRTAAGRTVECEFAGGEFLVGAAAGCDVRLPAGTPPVALQLTRKPDGVRARRVAAALPVLLNGAPLPAGTTTLLRDGDALTAANLAITIALPAVVAPPPPAIPAAPPPPPVPRPIVPAVPDLPAVYLSPKLVPIEVEEDADVPLAETVPDEPPPPIPPPPAPDFGAEYRKLADRMRALDAEEAERRAAWEARDADAARRQGELDRQTAELEADRARWDEQRRAAEQELADQRVAAAAEKERELDRARAEIEALRQEWADEHARQRAELAGAAETLSADRAAFEADRATLEPQKQTLRDDQSRVAAEAQELRRQRELFTADRAIFAGERLTFDTEKAAETERLASWEAALALRDAELTRRDDLVRAARDAFEQERAAFQAELAQLESRTAAVERGERELASRSQEVDDRLARLRTDAAELEETLRLATAEQDRLRAEAERLDRQKAELDAQSAGLAERAAQIEGQQAVVAVLRAKLDRGRQEMEREAWQLAAARIREDESQAELRKRIQEAEELRAAMTAVQADAELDRQRLEERQSLLTAGLAEIQQQKDALTSEATRLQALEADIDRRTAEIAEQAGMLKGRMTQALDLQARLEADRVAIREREAALAQSEEARQALQEQLRRRAEELSARSKTLDEMARQLAADRANLGEVRSAVETSRQTTAGELDAQRAELEARAAQLERQTAELAEKDAALARQVSRLKDVGAAVAAERKALATAREAWEGDRAAALEADRVSREELEAFRSRAAADLDSLRAQAPELDDQAKVALERLGAARDMLRNHLSELNEFSRTSRADLEAARAQVRQDAERLREQQEALDRAKDEHRLAVTAFRQQIIEWQGTVSDMRRLLSTSENRLEAKTVAATEAATAAADATRQLAEETDRLRREREELSARRGEMERHLADMREWYRKKLRELARTNAKQDAEPPELRIAEFGPGDAGAPGSESATRNPQPAIEELEPGDRQLGELLRSLALVDADTLTALWAEAVRQRRTLRQVLLASGAITLYQLALIEAGNLDALVLGRFRVFDRLRSSTKEAVYRVFDPARAGERSGGIYMLRHLGEAEAADAVRPDEFRQRFAAARDAAHPNLAAVVEVLDVGGRPAVLLEWLSGLASADWPPFAAHPGCWVRLATMAAGALDAAHRVGLAHGRLTSDSLMLTAEGALKVTGFGEPGWLSGAPAVAEVSFAADLRAFGQVLFGWSQLAVGRKRVARTKAFPEALWAVIRRLEADAEPPMADTVATAEPYGSAGELLADLQRIARDTPFSDDAWEKLLKYVADHAPDAPAGLKRAG
jgi:chromosome segregation ATPase